MASRAQIARLQQRIELAAASFQQQTPAKVVRIIQGLDETEDAAIERHLADYPEDRAHIERRSRFPTLIVVRIVRPKDYGIDGHAISS